MFFLIHNVIQTLQSFFLFLAASISCQSELSVIINRIVCASIMQTIYTVLKILFIADVCKYSCHFMLIGAVIKWSPILL